MPIYEYICPDCQHEFEQIQKISDAPLSHCGECGGDKLKKKVSATSFHLKGSGWYKDHYGLKSGSVSGDSGAPSESTESASTTSSGEGSSASTGEGSSASTGEGSSASSTAGDSGSD